MLSDTGKTQPPRAFVGSAASSLMRKLDSDGGARRAVCHAPWEGYLLIACAGWDVQNVPRLLRRVTILDVWSRFQHCYDPTHWPYHSFGSPEAVGHPWSLKSRTSKSAYATWIPTWIPAIRVVYFCLCPATDPETVPVTLLRSGSQKSYVTRPEFQALKQRVRLKPSSVVQSGLATLRDSLKPHLIGCHGFRYTITAAAQPSRASHSFSTHAT